MGGVQPRGGDLELGEKHAGVTDVGNLKQVESRLLGVACDSPSARF